MNFLFLQQESRLFIADNSSAVSSKVISLKKLKNCYLSLVRLTKVTTSKNLKKGNLFYSCLVRSKKTTIRKSGVSVKANKNETALLKKDKSPLGTRVYKSVFLEIKFSGYARICSLTKNVF